MLVLRPGMGKSAKAWEAWTYTQDVLYGPSRSHLDMYVPIYVK